MEVPQILTDAADTFQERDAKYGSAYLRQGEIMQAFFPNGIALRSPADFRRFALFEMVVGKMNRYTTAMLTGETHYDSPLDAAVYAAMLAKVDSDIAAAQLAKAAEDLMR